MIVLDHGEKLHKQKASRSGTSSSLEIIENSRKRNKHMSGSEGDIFRRPQQAVSEKNTDLSPPKQSTKMEPDDDIWTEKTACRSLNDSENKSYRDNDTEVSVFFPSRDDPVGIIEKKLNLVC